MSQLDEMGLNEIMLLLQEKQEATQEGNLLKLIQLKKDYPELFTKQFEDTVYSLIDNIDMLVNSLYFKAYRRQAEKKKFLVLDFPSWHKGMLDEALEKLEVIYYKNIQSIAPILIKEVVAESITMHHTHKLDDVNIHHIFPQLGIVIKYLLIYFPKEKQEKMLKYSLLKLDVDISSDKNNSEDTDTINLTMPLLPELIEAIKTMLDKTIKKFDQREGFYADCLFFCLLEVSEFIGQMSAHIAKIRGETREVLLRRVAAFILS